jgi:hypothetical protein
MMFLLLLLQTATFKLTLAENVALLSGAKRHPDSYITI